jgi:hypothetical protein
MSPVYTDPNVCDRKTTPGVFPKQPLMESSVCFHCARRGRGRSALVPFRNQSGSITITSTITDEALADEVCPIGNPQSPNRQSAMPRTRH